MWSFHEVKKAMTFEEAEAVVPNGFHDAQIESLYVDYKTGTLSLSMKLWVGELGTPSAEEYAVAELRVNRLLFCSIGSPDPRYPYVPDGDALDVDGADGWETWR